MIRQLNGQHYHSLIDYGIRNLARHREYINDLNVFPVPDGDTGTNMVMTMQNGFCAIKNLQDGLPTLSKRFAGAVVLGARGNSGVILSQFFKGFSETFYELATADCPTFIAALERGVKSAYGAVASPVEGTILTVLRESSDHVRAAFEKGSVETLQDVVGIFLDKARLTLEETPELLPILKSAGVVDSGGAGIVYLFEGMKKYLNNETVEAVLDGASPTEVIDYTRYTRQSEFPFGYCTELLIQLTDGREEMDYAAFCLALATLGDSIVTATEGDKVKLHIHTRTPEKVLALCHPFGEFLSLKIENMSVQHHEREETAVRKPIVTYENKCHHFSILAVAHDPLMKERFFEMGADFVMESDRLCPPAASDFIEAFERADSDTVLVFPNNKNTRLAAEQAKKLCRRVRVIILDTVSDAECYAALPMVDFEEENVELLAAQLNEVVANITTVVVSKATKNAVFDGRQIQKGDFVALLGEELLAVGESLTVLSKEVIATVMSREAKDVVTLFAASDREEDFTEEALSYLANEYPYTEATAVDAADPLFPLVLCFE